MAMLTQINWSDLQNELRVFKFAGGKFESVDTPCNSREAESWRIGFFYPTAYPGDPKQARKGAFIQWCGTWIEYNDEPAGDLFLSYSYIIR